MYIHAKSLFLNVHAHIVLSSREFSITCDNFLTDLVKAIEKWSTASFCVTFIITT